MEPIEYGQLAAFSQEVEEDLGLCIAYREGKKIAIQEDSTGKITARTGTIIGAWGIELAAYAGIKGFTDETAEKKLQNEILEKLRTFSNPNTLINKDKIQKYEELVKRITDLSAQYLSSAKENEEVGSYVKLVNEQIGKANAKIKEFHEARQNFEKILNQITQKDLPLQTRLEKCKYLLSHAYPGGKELYSECRQQIRDVIGEIIAEVKEQMKGINKEIVTHLRVPKHLIKDLYMLDVVLKELGEIVAEVDDRILDHRMEMNELRHQHESLMKQTDNVGSIASKFVEAAYEKLDERLDHNGKKMDEIGKKEEECRKKIESLPKRKEDIKRNLVGLLEAIGRDLQISLSVSKKAPADFWSGEIQAMEKKLLEFLEQKNKGKRTVETATAILRLEGAKKYIQQAKDLRQELLQIEATKLNLEGELKEVGSQRMACLREIDQLKSVQIKLREDLKILKESGPAAERIHRAASLIVESRKILGLEVSRKLSKEITALIPTLPEMELEWEVIETEAEVSPIVTFPEGEEKFRKEINEILE